MCIYIFCIYTVQGIGLHPFVEEYTLNPLSHAGIIEGQIEGTGLQPGVFAGCC